MKFRIPYSAALAGCIAFVLFLGGCGDSPSPEKSTLEKLNSPDADEQEQGLDEADDKYGEKK